MRNKYQQVMDRVEATEDMRQRVLDNVAAKAGTQQNRKITKLTRSIPLAVAACLVIAAIAVGGPRITDIFPGEGGGVDTTEAPVFNSVVCATLDELAEKCGFQPKQLGYLPFEASNTTYELYADTDAQTTYAAVDGQTATLTQFLLSDSSGEINGLEIEGENENQGYDYATWADDEFGYKLLLSNPVSKDEIEKIVASLG